VLHEPTSTAVGREGLLIGRRPEQMDAIARALADSGYRCTAVARGEGLQALSSMRPSFVVLDHDPPDLEAWQLLRRLVELRPAPVLVVSESEVEDATARALQIGADAFLVKPVGPEELAARVEAMLRRHSPTAPVPVLSGSPIEIDLHRKTVHALGREVLLTPTEFRLLAALAQRPGEVLSHTHLIAAVWPDSDRELSEVKLYVSYLRRTFRRTVAIDPIQTVRGIGYRYEPRVEGRGR
jgi:DNA-binding response OmpR family regulator